MLNPQSRRGTSGALNSEVRSISLTQAEWFVDADNGDDGNDGLTAATALQTLAELGQRLEGLIEQPTNVHLLSNFARTDPLFIKSTLGTSGFIKVSGENSTVLSTKTIAAVTALVPDVTQPDITVAGTDWAAEGLIGKRLRVVSSAGGTPIGTIAWITSVPGPTDTAVISTPYFADTSAAPFGFGISPIPGATLLVGDEVVIEDLTELSSLNIEFDDDQDRTDAFFTKFLLEGITSIQDGEIHEADFAPSSLTRIAAYGCGFSYLQINLGLSALLACKFTGSGGVPGGSLTLFSDVGNIVAGFFETTVDVRGSSNIAFFGECVAEAAGLPRALDTAKLNFTDGHAHNFGDSAIEARDGTSVQVTGLVWGSSAVGGSLGIAISSNCVIAYTVLPTVVGAAGETSIASVLTLYAALPLYDTATAAGIVALLF